MSAKIPRWVITKRRKLRKQFRRLERFDKQSSKAKFRTKGN